MPANRSDSPNPDEINRLVRLGLTCTTAMAVANGRRDEAFEVARAKESRKVYGWCKGRKNIPAALKAIWDKAPENYYLAFDGAEPGDHASADFVLFDANIDDVDRRLTHHSSRDKDPWHILYKRKSCGIAYRWLHGSGVTPPVIKEDQGRIQIEGGMHRYHLAKHYGTISMPFLVRKSEFSKVMAMIPSAVCDPKHSKS
jgi:hypothetical protein